MANPSSQDKGCPLDDPWGRQWRRYTQGKANAETHPELRRKLAGDTWFRYQAHLQHHDTTRALAARFEFESDTKKVGILTDDQKGLNNYAEPSLHLAVKGRSRSKLFRSSLDKTHPAFKEFLSDRQNRKESSAKTDIAKFSDALKNSTAKRTKFSLSRKEEKIAPAKTISKQILPETEAKPPGLSKEVPKVDVPRVQGQNFFGPRFGGPQDKASFRPTFQGATNRVPEVTDRRVANSAPKFGLPGMGPRLPTQAVPRFPQVQRDGPTFKSYNGSSSKCNENANITPVGDPIRAFRTAHDELVIQNNQKRTNEISSNSYGAVKKTLGVPRGGNVAGTFKPPIANKGLTVEPVQGENHSNGLLSNEKLKHLDPKMVELIQNEIMDKGSPIGWDDIAGLDFVKVTVKEIVVFPLLRPDIFKGLRGPPKGLLLFGPPGTGKTLIGKCIACQSNSTFFSISASSLTSKWVGEGEKMVRTLFEVARTFQPAVVFIDEIDSLLSQRSDTEHESSRRIKTEFLVQLDGATSVGDERILVVGATNRPQDLDEAARRRLVKRLYVPLPEQNAREQIIYNLLATQSHSMSAAEISTIAAKAEGYSGADMSNLCKEAAMGPIRSLDYSKIDQIMMEDVRPIKFEDFVDAFKQVRASVSSNDLQQYMEWDAKYGSGK